MQIDGKEVKKTIKHSGTTEFTNAMRIYFDYNGLLRFYWFRKHATSAPQVD